MTFINNFVTGKWHMCVNAHRVLQTSLDAPSLSAFFLWHNNKSRSFLEPRLMKPLLSMRDYSWDEDRESSTISRPRCNSPSANHKNREETETTHPFLRLLQKSLTYKRRPWYALLRYRSFCVAKQVSLRWYHEFSESSRKSSGTHDEISNLSMSQPRQVLFVRQSFSIIVKLIYFSF